MQIINPPGSGGAAVWGGITGTLSAQTDLQGALDAKSPSFRGVQLGVTAPVFVGGPVANTITLIPFNVANIDTDAIYTSGSTITVPAAWDGKRAVISAGIANNAWPSGTPEPTKGRSLTIHRTVSSVKSNITGSTQDSVYVAALNAKTPILTLATGDIIGADYLTTGTSAAGYGIPGVFLTIQLLT